MALAVIGAGFGRTGTDSMRNALNLLGFGPCHHMRELTKDPEQKRLWRALAHGATPDWDRLFSGYGAAVDWPSAYYWRELVTAYPEAKVLLTTRSPESWLASMEKTIFRVFRETPDPESVGETLIAEGTFEGRYDDPDHVMAVYRRHLVEVQDTILPERLLVFELGDGWGPLCDFLGVAVPDVPFPRTNSTAEFNSPSET